MKRFHRNLWILSGCLFLVGIIIGAIGLSIVGFQFSNLDDDAGQTKNYTVQTDATELERIVVDTFDQSIIICPSENDEIKVSYYEKEKEPISVSENDSVLTISRNDERKWYDYVLNFSWNNGSVILYLPKEYKGELELNTTNATVDLSLENSSEMQKIICGTSNAPIHLENLQSANNIEATTTNGTISADNVKAKKEFMAETTNGEITLLGVAAGTVCAAKTTNAWVTADTLSATQCLLTSTNGNITFDSILSDTIELKTSNGSVSGEIKGHLSDYQIESKTSNGNNTLPERTATGNKSLKIKTSNGDIAVHFTGD